MSRPQRDSLRWGLMVMRIRLSLTEAHTGVPVWALNNLSARTWNLVVRLFDALEVVGLSSSLDLLWRRQQRSSLDWRHRGRLVRQRLHLDLLHDWCPLIRRNLLKEIDERWGQNKEYDYGGDHEQKTNDGTADASQKNFSSVRSRVSVSRESVTHPIFSFKREWNTRAVVARRGRLYIIKVY